MIGGRPRPVKRARSRRALARRRAVGLVPGVRQARARPLPAVPARRAAHEPRLGVPRVPAPAPGPGRVPRARRGGPRAVRGARLLAAVRLVVGVALAALMLGEAPGATRSAASRCSPGSRW